MAYSSDQFLIARGGLMNVRIPEFTVFDVAAGKRNELLTSQQSTNCAS